MSNVKWIRITVDMFDDEKIRLIEQMPEADTILIIWVKLLAQAGKTNASGYIYLNENIPFTDEMLATIFNRPINTVRLALKTFKDFGMINIDEQSFISIANWEKHQNEEGLARIREQTKKRVARYRERKQLEQSKEENSDVTLPVTLRNATDIEKNKNKKENKNNKYIRDLFDHYLSKNIIKHQKITSAMRSAINARLRDYSFEQLIQVIDNYAEVYSSDKYWFTQKYSLADLMRDKDVRKFIDDAEPLKNFAKRGVNNDGGFYQHRASNTRSNGKSTSYEQAKQELAAAEQAFRGGM